MTQLRPDRRHAASDFLQRLSFRLDPNEPQRNRGDQESQREGVQHVGASSVLQHEADHGGREERADPADAEEPANRRCTQMRWIKLANIDAGRTIDARIDPADQSDGDIEPDAGGVCKPQVKERADEVGRNDRSGTSTRCPNVVIKGQA
jgi:hypothetical protein